VERGGALKEENDFICKNNSIYVMYNMSPSFSIDSIAFDSDNLTVGLTTYYVTYTYDGDTITVTATLVELVIIYALLNALGYPVSDLM
jgi:hypothetical protein